MIAPTKHMLSTAAMVLAAVVSGCGTPLVPISDVPLDVNGVQPRSAARLAELRDLSHAANASTVPRGDLSAEAFLNLGHACLARTITGCATAAYGNAVALAPEDAEARFFSAQALALAGRPADAARELKAGLALSPDDQWARLHLAEALVEANQEQEAAGVLDQVLAGNPSDQGVRAQALYTKAQLELETDPGAALASLDLALPLAPTATLIQRSRAEALRRLGRAEEAEVALAQAGERQIAVDDPRARVVALESRRAAFDAVIDLATDPTSQPEVILGFADAQFGESRNAVLEPEQLVQKAGTLEPRAEARLLWLAGTLHERRGGHLEARGRFSRASELDPALVEARVGLASTHFHLGDAGAALGVLADVLSSSENAAALDLRSQILLSAGRFPEAERDLRRAIELAPRQGALQLRLAELAERSGRPEMALGLYEQAVGLTPSASERSLAFYRMARLRALSGDLSGSESDLRRAATLDPTFLDPHLALGGLLLEAGRVDEALAVWRRASLFVPTSPAPRRAEAAALLMEKRWAEATDRLADAVRLFPKDPSLVGTLARHFSACPDLSVRNAPRALELAKLALEMAPTAANRETYAMAQAESGDFGGAASTQEALIKELGPRAGARGPALVANLNRYRQGERCCAPQ